MGAQDAAKIWDRIKDISYMTFSSIKKKINPNNRKHCFELFGLDFIIDADRKVWLIEVNENPCLECSSPFLEVIIPRMLDDAFRLTVDQVMGLRRGNNSSYPVLGYPCTINMW